MQAALIVLFLLAYAAIAFEHALQVSKSAAALLGAGVLWTVYAVATGDAALVQHQLAESLTQTAQIVFFLMGAMTIVEVVDAHNGFAVITSRIQTRSLAALLWLIGLVTFLLSAILDNLTTTLVMISLLKKLLGKRGDRLVFSGIVIIAANAGGAWSPIGDVTTTMLWIGGQVSGGAIMQALFIPSLVNALVPLLVMGVVLRGKAVVPPTDEGTHEHRSNMRALEQNLMFVLGLGILALVPLFKQLTHLPPFMGVLLGLGLLWLVGDVLHRGKTEEARHRLNLTQALQRIDMTSVVFFIGILLSVAVLEHAHILVAVADWLARVVGRQDLIVMIIGVVSAIVDNVPLVAATMGMYDMAQYPRDSFLWTFLAYCSGTGGSILIIGSAAGVAAMGLERIDFAWYLKRFSALALAGYLAGSLAYIAQHQLTH